MPDTGLPASSAPAALTFLVGAVDRLHSGLPDDHMQWLQCGGFVIESGSSHGALARHVIETAGLYCRALADGVIEPIDAEQRHFVDAANGRADPTGDIEKAWLEFVERHPDPVPNDPEAATSR